MLTLFRWLLRLTVGLIVVAVAAIALAWYFAVRSLPDYAGNWTVAGLQAPVEIVRSTDNVPHIFGESDADVFLALGLAHAQDRLFQMVVLRRAAQGRLSELYGARAYASDDLARRLGLMRNATASLPAQDGYTRAALSAYAEGVNQWIQIVNREARGRGAPEFFLYPDEIAWWQPEDSLAILKLIAAGSTRALSEEVLRARLSLAAPGRGPEILARRNDPALPAYADLFPDAKLIPTAMPVPPGESWFARLAGYVSPGGGAAAGTAFAAAPARTAAGAPLIAGSLDVALTVPSLFYLARLELASGGVIGATIPGIPAVISGRSPALAWAIAPAQVDDQDLLVEEVAPGDPDRYLTPEGWAAFQTRTEVIRVRGAEDQHAVLRETVNGPVLPAGHFGLAEILPAGHVAALSWTGLSGDDTTMTALTGLMRAPDRGAAVHAAAEVLAPAVTITLADANGISQILAGGRPVRGPGHQTAGLMPTPGWMPENRWQGLLPPSTAPQASDPAGGAIAAAGPGGGPAEGPRLSRLAGLLDGREIHSRDSFMAAQLDTVSPAARALLPLVGADLWFTGDPAPRGTPERQRQDALALLAAWDGEMSEHLPEPAIYAVWMAELQRRLVRDELGPVAEAIDGLRPAFIDRVFRNLGGAAVWCDVVQSAPVEDCATMARQSLDAAILELTARFGPDVASWRWGDLHEARHLHPALGQAAGLGPIVNLRQSMSGDDFTLAEGRSIHAGPLPWAVVRAAGYRAVIDLADPDSSVFVISTGQSGHPLSRHYDDLSELWRRGEYIAMSLDPALARAAAEGVTVLTPAGAE
ncbi:penicillin acylase family protein [Paracoccus sp. S-4012]|uniref:penicillin acylase family protein n=1 Tax=Paracoccus sp. S-4012 TaxID=2665648 RepID=UPI0012AFB431|nr:penicillin acylase family protein [Paracoccus sp. S-4012]MRX50163.1 penicillin acylase family protein [Paracoccus sp. S-4012]